MSDQAESTLFSREGLRTRRSLGQRLWRLARSKPLGTFSLLVILGLVAMALFADQIAPHDPLALNRGKELSPPSREYPMGNDQFGRDVMSRVIHGSRTSLLVGVSAVALGLVFGVSIGMVSAYVVGRFDLFVQRVMDSIDAFPGIILALAIIAALSPSLLNVIIAIGVSDIPRNNRIVRGSVLSEKNNVYVEAAKAIGNSEFRIMWRHIFPNVTAPTIIIAATQLGSAILAEASLSFLGVGVPPPNPSWGTMLAGDNRIFMIGSPHLAIFPGLAISFAVLGWNLLGDALRDVWDPRLRGR